jgi:hypothetical protein
LRLPLSKALRAAVTRNLPPARFFFPAARRSFCWVLLGAQEPLPRPPPCLPGWSASVYQPLCAGEPAVTNHKSVLQAGTTRSQYPSGSGSPVMRPKRSPVQVANGGDSKESEPPLTRRVKTHTATSQDSSTPGSLAMAFSRSGNKVVARNLTTVPLCWRCRAERIRESHRPTKRSRNRA